MARVSFPAVNVLGNWYLPTLLVFVISRYYVQEQSLSMSLSRLLELLDSLLLSCMGCMTSSRGLVHQSCTRFHQRNHMSVMAPDGDGMDGTRWNIGTASFHWYITRSQNHQTFGRFWCLWFRLYSCFPYPCCESSRLGYSVLHQYFVQMIQMINLSPLDNTLTDTLLLSEHRSLFQYPNGGYGR